MGATARHIFLSSCIAGTTYGIRAAVKQQRYKHRKGSNFSILLRPRSDSASFCSESKEQKQTFHCPFAERACVAVASDLLHHSDVAFVKKAPMARRVTTRAGDVADNVVEDVEFGHHVPPTRFSLLGVIQQRAPFFLSTTKNKRTSDNITKLSINTERNTSLKYYNCLCNS